MNNFKSKILNLLKEGDSALDLFSPKGINRRLNSLSELEKTMLTKYTKGTKVKVFIEEMNRYVDGKIIDPPEFNEFEGKEEWSCMCLLYIKKEYVKPGQKFGTYKAACNWNFELNHWEKNSNKFSDMFWETVYGTKELNESDDLFKPRRIEDREYKKLEEIENNIKKVFELYPDVDKNRFNEIVIVKAIKQLPSKDYYEFDILTTRFFLRMNTVFLNNYKKFSVFSLTDETEIFSDFLEEILNHFEKATSIFLDETLFYFFNAQQINE